MQIFRSIQEVPANFGPSVVTVGNFDGVHCGHQTVIADVIQRARALHAQSVALTFEPHPLRILRPEIPLRLIAPLQEKLVLLEQTGLDAVLVLPFTQQLSRWTPRQFAEIVLRDTLHAVEVQEGENFRFGVDAQAGVQDLAALGQELGFTARVHRPTLRRGMEVSSSVVRNAIAEGNMRRARQLLGRPFEIRSFPAPGRGYGSRYTVPTINLASYTELAPANGVYVTCMNVADERFEAVTNVGVRPTFGDSALTIETHILDFHPIALDEKTQLRLVFLDRLRGEIKWPSPEALKAQIGKDIARVRHYFGLYRAITQERVENEFRQ
jgi:riboflavin kinase/FMN adenylyltransferase